MIAIITTTKAPAKRIEAAIFVTDFGRELRVTMGGSDLVESMLSRIGDEPLEQRAAEMRRALEDKGWRDATNPLDEWDDAGMTPLLYAVFRGDVEEVRSLLDRGADPDRPNKAGDAPLWHAEDDFGLTEIAALLRQRGAMRK